MVQVVPSVALYVQQASSAHQTRLLFPLAACNQGTLIAFHSAAQSLDQGVE